MTVNIFYKFVMLIYEMMDFVSPPYDSKPRNIKKLILGWSILGVVLVVVAGSILYVNAEKRRIAADSARPKAIISGTINDLTNKAIGGVNLDVVNSEGQIVSSIVSFENGSYQFVLSPGLYRIVASYENAQTSKQVYLVQNSNEKVNIILNQP